MTWEYRSTISDSIHRVCEADGRSAWGIVNSGFDEDAPDVIGSTEVDLPVGRRTLLVVPACPGGLVLDAVRAYQGLTEAELTTLFLGIVDELSSAVQPEERLTLAAFGLDASGRPVLIPGIATTLATSPRRALGEMLYHAGYGSPWTECLLPVNLAFAKASSTMRSIVGDLLADSPADSSVGPALAEVAAAMRGLARPAPLPLVPADRDIAPEAALTARLRAVSGRAVRADNEGRVDGGNSVARRRGIDREHDTDDGRISTVQAPSPTGENGARAAERLRAASRRPRSRRRRRDRRRNTSLLAWVSAQIGERLVSVRERFGVSRRNRSRGVSRPGRLITAAVCLTIIGGIVIWASWPDSDAGDQRQTAATAGTSAEAETSAEAKTKSRESRTDAAPTNDEVAEVIDVLSADRARALSEGDVAALRKLTVPGSAAAAADELIDHSVFTGGDYVIEVDAVKVLSADAGRIVASARMHSHAGTGETSEDFGTMTVEFELKRIDDHWRVEQVTEVGDGGDAVHP
jgi:hypothetical protein